MPTSSSEFPGCRLDSRFAGFGLAAGVHEHVRAAFADGQEPAGVVEDADGGDNDAVFHAAIGLSSGTRCDASSRSFCGPWTSQV